MYILPKNDQNGQNKNFSWHNTAIRWFKAIVPNSAQALDKSDVWFRRKCPKTWFLSEKGQILDKKGSRFFCQNRNFYWPFLNNKLSLNSKN